MLGATSSVKQIGTPYFFLNIRTLDIIFRVSGWENKLCSDEENIIRCKVNASPSTNLQKA